MCELFLKAFQYVLRSKLIRGNVIRNVFEARLNLLFNGSAIHLLEIGICRVLRMTMVLGTFAETKVPRAER